MTAFTAITGSLKFTQSVGHVGDEFHPFPLNQFFLNEDSGTVGGLLELSIVTLTYLFLLLTAFFSVSLFRSCVTLKTLLIADSEEFAI